MQLRLGIDIACRAPHQASLADERGECIFTGRRFRTNVADLDRLWATLPEGTEPADVSVIMEPTRNAWVPLAAWFRRRGARIVLVPPERSADLRAYYAKHTKTDRLDSRMLARLPLLHPEGLHEELGLGPGDRLRRATRLHQTLTKRRSQCLARLDAMLEILGPSWLGVFGSHMSNRTPLRFLAAGYACPHTVKRLGRARVARFLSRHSRGRWGEAEAEALLQAATETVALWEDDLEFAELADDIAIEARLALRLGEELKDLDERIAIFLAEADPAGILTSVPGVGRVLGGQILGRLGDPTRFRTLAGARSFSGLVPSLDASGMTGRHGGPTKRGDASLREAVFLAADQARRCDPSLAARYHRLMVEGGKHHNSALCHVAATCSPGSSPAGEPESSTSSEMSTAPPWTPNRADGSSASATRSPPTCELRAGQVAKMERAGETRGRMAPRRPARSGTTLEPSPGLDIGWELNGTAYTSRGFRARLSELGITHRRGGYRDSESQAFIESWFSKLKEREVWRHDYETLAHARAGVERYVNRYHHRPHQFLSYRTRRR